MMLNKIISWFKRPKNIDVTKSKMFGHVVIRDADTKEVIRDAYNAINFANMSQALALSLANRPDGSIFYMVFGNGGSVTSVVDTITYYPPNVTGNSALYNQTYQKIVDDTSPLNNDPTNCYMRVSHVTGVPYSDIQVVCTLEYDEPSGQMAFDNAPLTNNNNPSGTGSALSTYIFDEIGLTTAMAINGGTQPLLLSHVIFHPVKNLLIVPLKWYIRFAYMSEAKKNGIPFSDYEKLLSFQNGVCKLCQKPQERKKGELMSNRHRNQRLYSF